MPVRVWDNKENKSKTVSEQEAERGLAQGIFQIESGIDLPVRDPDGNKYTIKSDDAAKAFSKGWTYERPEQVKETFDTAKEKAVKEVASDMPGTAFAQGVLKSATFGLSDAVIQAFTDVEPEFQQAVQEENPIAYTAGEIAGALPVGSVAPAALAARGTQALAKATATNPVARATIDMAADGLAYGLGESISDISLGRPDEVATNLILGGGLGGALGAVTGTLAPVAKAVKSGILDTSEALITKGTEKLGTTLAKRRSKNLGIEGAEELIDSGRYVDVLDDTKIKEKTESAKDYLHSASGEEKMFAKEARQIKNELKQQKKVLSSQLKNLQDSQKEEVKNLLANLEIEKVKDLDELAIKLSDAEGSVQTMTSTMYQEAKETIQEQVGKLPAIEGKNRAQLDDLYEDITTTAGILKKDPKYYTADGTMIDDIMSQNISKLQAGPTSTDPASNVLALLDLRQNIASRVKWNAISESDKALLNLYGTINRSIEDIFPGVSKTLRSADELYTIGSNVRDLAKTYKRKGIVDPGLSIKDMDSGKTLISNKVKQGGTYDRARILKSLTQDPQGKATMEAMLGNIDEVFERVGDTLDTSITDSIRKSVGKVSDIPLAKLKASIPSEKYNLMKTQLKESLGDIDESLQEDMIGLLAKFAKSNPAQKAERMEKLRKAKEMFSQVRMNTAEKYAYLTKELGEEGAAKEAQDLLQMQKDMAIMNQMDVGDKISSFSKIGALGAAFTGQPHVAAAALAAAKAVSLANSPKAALAVIPQVAKFAESGKKALDRFSTGFAKRLTGKGAQRTALITMSEDEYKKVSTSLQENQDPSKMQEKINASLEPLASAPNVQLALMESMVRTNQYLFSKLPKNPLEGQSVFTPEWKPSRAERDTFARIVRVASNPVSLFDKINEGTVTPEELDAIKTLHPAMYEEMKVRMVKEISQLKSPPPYDVSLSLGYVFDTPIDPTQKNGYVMFMQELIASYPQQTVSSNRSMSKLDPETFLSSGQQITLK